MTDPNNPEWLADLLSEMYWKGFRAGRKEEREERKRMEEKND